MIYQEPYQSKV